MTHGSATVPDPLHPLHRHDVGACELPLPCELEPVAFATRQIQQRDIVVNECSISREAALSSAAGRTLSSAPEVTGAANHNSKP